MHIYNKSYLSVHSKIQLPYSLYSDDTRSLVGTLNHAFLVISLGQSYNARQFVNFIWK